MLSKISYLSLVFILLGCTPILQAETNSLEAKSPQAVPKAAPLEAKSSQAITSKIADGTDRTPLLKAPIETQTAKFTWGKPGGDMSEYREANLSYPTVAKLSNSQLQAKIQDSISLKSVFGRSLADMEAEFKTAHWLTSLEYHVDYNDKGLLSLTYTGMGSAAYPSSFVHYRSVNLATGSILLVHDLFKTESVGMIAMQVDKQLQAAIAVKVAELDQPDYKDIDPTIFTSHRFRSKNLNDFTLTPEGIVFHYQFGFPHVMLALEPKGDFLMTYDELKTYVKPGSPLESLIKK